MSSIKDTFSVIKDFLKSAIFNIKTTPPVVDSNLFENMTNETRELAQSIRGHVLSYDGNFALEEVGYHPFRGLLIAQSEDSVFFWVTGSDNASRFYWLKIENIKHRHHLSLYTSLYLKKYDKMPPWPELIIGLDWQVEPYKGGHEITCLNTPIGGNFDYSELVEKFQSRYGDRNKKRSKATGRQGDASGFSELELKPIAPKGDGNGPR